MEENAQEGSESNIDNNPSDEEPKKRFPSFKINLSGIKNIYETQYKKLLIIPIAILLIAILLIGFNLALTGEFIQRDVSLKVLVY